MGECADGDAINSGLGDGAHVIKIDTPGNFEKGIGRDGVAERNGFADGLEGHVVEHYDACACGECGAEHFKVLDLDLDGSPEAALTGEVPGGEDGVGDGNVGSAQVVVLDEYLLV